MTKLFDVQHIRADKPAQKTIRGHHGAMTLAICGFNLERC